MMRGFFLFGVLAMALSTLGATASEGWTAAEAWDGFLKEYVAEQGATTVVDYTGVLETPKSLRRIVAALAAVDSETFASWSEPARLAFLINAYNALTIQLIVENYPLQSIRDLEAPWDTPRFVLLGRRRSLNEIEHTMIRGRFEEPRIHFALNCASRSCPALSRDAYRADTLDHQLEAATRRFLTDRNMNSIDSQGRLSVSPLFQWYAQDFSGPAGVLDFVAARFGGDDDLRRRIEGGDVEVVYRDYDWRLNDRQR